MTTTTLPSRTVVEWPVRGRFDLRQSIGFGFGSRTAGVGDTMRLAFVLDRQVGLTQQRLRQCDRDRRSIAPQLQAALAAALTVRPILLT